MKKAIIMLIISAITIPIMAQQKIIQTAGRDALGEFAPEFARLTTTSCLAKCGAATTSSHSATAVS